MTEKFEEAKAYPIIPPEEVIRKLPFWWFTDIAISFRANKKRENIILGVYDSKLESCCCPFFDMSRTIDVTIPYDPKIYPEIRSFENFPPSEGSPFFLRSRLAT